jgi:hypothetical protein
LRAPDTIRDGRNRSEWARDGASRQDDHEGNLTESREVEDRMPVVIAVLLALLWVFALRRWYRQAPSPLESVEHQQRALDALQHATSRARTGPAPTNAGAGAGRATAGNAGFPVPVHAGRRQRSFGPIVAAFVGTLLLVGVGAVWWIGRKPAAKQSATAASSPTSSARRAVTTTTTIAPTTTTTTAPATLATVTSQTSRSVVYAVDKPAFTLTISASAPCWVRATSGSAASGSGATSNSSSTSSSNSSSTSSGSSSGTGGSQSGPLFEGTLHAGDNQQIAATGSLVVRLGAANNVTLAIDGQPLAIPSQTGRTLDLTFNGSSNGT